MSTNFVKIEVDKIISDQKNFPSPLNIAMASTWILGNLKGVNLKIFNVSEVSSLSDYSVIASATNTKQAQAMADEITSNLKRSGHKRISCEGLQDANWILLDIGDVIIHIFLETSRGNYNLEALWSDCPTIEIPTSYYFSDDQNDSQEDTEKSYF